MILRINIKLFNHLKATILPYCFSGSTGMFMVAVKLMDTSSYWIFLCRNSFYTKATDSRSFLYSWKYNRSISLPSISSTLNTSLNPSISVICCLSGFCLFLHFFFFIFIFWSTETTTANLQGLTHLTPSKNTNQVTLHNKHRNHLIWA